VTHEVIEGDGIVLRRTTEADLPTLRAFFTNPDFDERWGGRPLSDDEISAKYVGRRSPAVECFIVQEGQRSVGFVQYHLAEGRLRPGASRREGGRARAVLAHGVAARRVEDRRGAVVVAAAWHRG